MKPIATLSALKRFIAFAIFCIAAVSASAQAYYLNVYGKNGFYTRFLINDLDSLSLSFEEVPVKPDTIPSDILLTNNIKIVVKEVFEGESRTYVDPRIVADPDSADNQCIVVATRPNPSAHYADEFFLCITEELEVGDELTISMRVKADKPQDADVVLPQRGPGEYTAGLAFDAPSFNTVWQYYEWKVTVSNAQVNTYSFCLSKLAEGNNIYFDDISVKVTSPSPVEPDTIPSGILLTDNIEIVVKEVVNGESRSYESPRIVADPDNADNQCIVVATRPNPSAHYADEFFLCITEELEVGDEMTISMRVKADKHQDADQVLAQKGPAMYYGLAPFKAPSFDTEWKYYEWTFAVTDTAINTYSFCLSKLAEGNNIYFDDISVKVTSPSPVEPDTIPSGILLTDNIEIVVKEVVNGESRSYESPRIVADPDNADNQCIVVATRPNPSAHYADEFFLCITEELEVGDEMTISMRVKADKYQDADQVLAQKGPSMYYGLAPFKAPSFDTEWQYYEWTFAVTDTAINTYSFCLSKLAEGNNIYFDDISVKVTSPSPVEPDTIPSGILLTDNIKIVVKEVFEGESRTYVDPRIVVDPDSADNQCIVVTTQPNPYAHYDAEFFLCITEELEVGDEMTISMRVKADKPQDADQVLPQRGPGEYTAGLAFDAPSFDTVWQYYEWNVTVSNAQVNTYSFCLSKLADGNNIYFDDISVKVTSPSPVEPDTIPSGILLSDNFTISVKDLVDGQILSNAAPRIVTDPDSADNKCIVVTTKSSPSSSYEAQLLINLNETLDPGMQFVVSMKIKADKDQSSEYVILDPNGDYLNGFSKWNSPTFGTTWEDCIMTVDVTRPNTKTLALNISTLNEGNNVYFDDITVTVDDIYGGNLSLAENEVDLDLGRQKYPLSATDGFGVSYNLYCTWTSGDENIATVDGAGRVTAVGVGSTIITAKFRDDIDTCTVTVFEWSYMADGTENNHDYVDLGLSVNWATFNVGSTSMTGFGDFYAWGEVEPYYADGYAYSEQTVWKSGKESGYVAESNRYYASEGYELHQGWTKYCTDSLCGKDEFEDHLTVLASSDDVASAIWGGSWRMPDYDEFNELKENCDWFWMIIDGVKGFKVVSKVKGYEDKFIFIPSAGQRTRERYYANEGRYWTRTLDSNYPESAYALDFMDAYSYFAKYSRGDGMSVRAVCPKE